MAHFLGNEDTTSTPTGQSQDVSLAVLQFVALVRGEWGVQAPRSPFRVVRVTAEEQYCLGCYGVRVHDVIEGAERKMAICRYCGKERKG